MGSKARIAADILPIILKDRKPGQWYVEPFCGGCNTVDKVDNPRLAADNNKYLIRMLQLLQDGKVFQTELPKDVYDCARRQWYEKESGKATGLYWGDGDIGWVGFMASANGRFFEGGYSGVSQTKVGTSRNYIDESIRNIQKQMPLLSGVEFRSGDYRQLEIPENSIVYCDIPYKGTKQYATSKGFDHSAFWNWCRTLSAAGHTVYVSEYTAPPDFECVWQKEVKSSLSANGVAGGNKLSVEKLFKPRA